MTATVEVNLNLLLKKASVKIQLRFLVNVNYITWIIKCNICDTNRILTNFPFPKKKIKVNEFENLNQHKINKSIIICYMYYIYSMLDDYYCN